MMEPRARLVSRDSLVAARRSFERWRRSRTPSRRIPEVLWRIAIGLAQEHGVSKTVRALRLNYYALKKRMAFAPAVNPELDEQGRRGFVELPLFARPMSPEWSLEIEDGHGARVRVELKGAAGSELESLARLLWMVQR